MSTSFKTVGLLNFLSDGGTIDTIRRLVRTLQALNIDTLIEQNTYQRFQSAIDSESALSSLPLRQMQDCCDLLIVIGGDGSLLHVARDIAEAAVPLLGINRGRRGFLNDISPADLEVQVPKIIQGDFVKSERFLLRGQVIRDGSAVAEVLALNDIVLQSLRSRMLDLKLHIDNHFVYDLRSDGLIVATPTGSTAYALSGGGAILLPELNVIEVVPINSHTLSNRPIIVDSASCLNVEVPESNRVEVQLINDGQGQLDLICGDNVRISRFHKTISLLRLSSQDFYQSCRNKLNWHNE